MSQAFQVLFLIFAVAFPFIAMPLMWRRMKRVRGQVYGEREEPLHEQPWQEPAGEAGAERGLARSSSPNDELIALGDRARHGRWPLDNQ
ncbi:hypothetical protein ACFQ1E_07740 [Sphingomonas canadensis]|uniref:Uncharacterized protein n=1 Tax=Sphingomonas canadensis TaxID=1219257 RepID=A0ABW3H9W3_9SPHN|nr:hypothetical protein [Sphingomonas canadensis]MCW3835927.1 hypothetical protein [Sphingomonas canadensis]